MNFQECMQGHMDAGSVEAEQGRRAQGLWRELADDYERMGHTRDAAEQMAGEDVAAALKREAGQKRNRYLATIVVRRGLEQSAKVASNKDLRTLTTRAVDALDFEQRALVHQAHGRVSEYLKDHHPDLLGRITKPGQAQNVLRELMGEHTGDERATLLAQAIENNREIQRLQYNEFGGNMGKLEARGVRHVHDRMRVTQAKFDRWFADTKGKLDWSRIEDVRTGKPFQPDGAAPPAEDVQRRFLQDVYDNIAYGKGTRDAVYGRPRTSGLSIENQRVLHFRSADDWVSYNKAYGMGSPFDAITAEIDHMARNIAQMRRFGPDPLSGVDYLGQLAQKEVRERRLEDLVLIAKGDAYHAMHMMKVLLPGPGPESPVQQKAATFFSTTRKLISSMFLDRAVISSLSDHNSMRLAARAIDLNPGGVFATYARLLADAAKGGGELTEDLRRQGWIAETMANPGSTMDRYMSEWHVAEWASVLSNTSMRIQGLAAHTDNLKMAFQHGIAGEMADQAHLPMDQIKSGLAEQMQAHGITPADWDTFRDAGGIYRAPNGAQFLSPSWWHAAVDLEDKVKDDLFLKFQSFMEAWTERAVPTHSAYGMGFIDPKAWGLPPGSVPYELIKSGGMFKSFVAAYVTNQIRMISAQKGPLAKGLYALDLLASSTLIGALTLQINDVLMGRDPQDMTQPGFWARSVFRGGGLGPVGDIISAGQSSWGGGIGSYLGGPIPQAAEDAYDLLIKTSVQEALNLLDPANAKPTNFAKTLSRLGKRYTPMGQTPLLAGGAAMDRLFWDQLQMYMDPDSVNALISAAQRRKTDYGQGMWWPDASAVPVRAPSYGALD